MIVTHDRIFWSTTIISREKILFRPSITVVREAILSYLPTIIIFNMLIISYVNANLRWSITIKRILSLTMVHCSLVNDLPFKEKGTTVASDAFFRIFSSNTRSRCKSNENLCASFHFLLGRVGNFGRNSGR